MSQGVNASDTVAVVREIVTRLLFDQFMGGGLNFGDCLAGHLLGTLYSIFRSVSQLDAALSHMFAHFGATLRHQQHCGRSANHRAKKEPGQKQQIIVSFAHLTSNQVCFSKLYTI
jgi:hypothetical protein